MFAAHAIAVAGPCAALMASDDDLGALLGHRFGDRAPDAP
jgi:hypothetical protein